MPHKRRMAWVAEWNQCRRKSVCVVVEAMRTADIYLRVLISALLMKQLDFIL